MRRDFKIDLILWMQDMVLRDKGIDLINTATDVVRTPVVYRETHFYLRHYIMAAYDILGVSDGKVYDIRVYARFGMRRFFSSHPVTDLTPTIDADNLFAYNLFLEEPEVAIYKLYRRFPLPGNCPVSPACFCSHSPIPRMLKTLDGHPLCPKIGHLPIITLIGEATQTYPYGTFFSDPGATAWDEEDGDLSYALITMIPDEIYSTGTHEVVYSVTDHDNNTVEAVRLVTVLPFNHGPSITLLPWEGEINPIHIPWGYPVDDIVKATAIDYEDGDITASIVVSGSIDTNTTGSYTLTYSVTDSGGKSATVDREVIVGENLAPTITLLPDATGATTPIDIPYGSNVSVIPSVTAHDPEDGDIIGSLVVTGLPNTLVAGSHTVTYTVTDSGGKSATVDREVIVLANNPPIVTLLANANGDTTPISIHQWDAFTDPGATATDAEDGDLTANIIVSGIVDSSVSGTHTITYRVSDSFGVESSVIREVLVIANESPVITLLPDANGGTNILTIPYLSTWLDPGATATDAEDGDLTNIITIGGDLVDTTISGEYRITYSVTDSGGLSNIVTRVVNVAANTAPVITLLGDANMTLTQGNPFTDPGAIAGDAEEGDITDRIVVSGDTVDTSVLGDYTITYTITDNGGASASVSRTVSVAPPEEVLTITVIPPADSVGFFDGSYDHGTDQETDVNIKRIFVTRPLDTRFVTATIDNKDAVAEYEMTYQYEIDVIQTYLSCVDRLATDVNQIAAELDAAAAEGKLLGMRRWNINVTTGVVRGALTLEPAVDFITTDANGVEQLNYHCTMDSDGDGFGVVAFDLHIHPSTGYSVVATSSIDGDISDEIVLTADTDLWELWYPVEVSGGNIPVIYTFTVTHNGKTVSTTIDQINHFAYYYDLNIYWDWTPTLTSMRTRVWKVVPITTEATNYLKHIKITDTDDNDILLGGAVGILGPVVSGGRIYLNNESITVSDANGVMPKHAIADMTVPGEVGYIIEGNNTLPVKSLTVVGIDDPDQAVYPQALGFQLYVGDMVGHIGNDSMLEDIDSVNWTLVHETPVDNTGWSPGQVKVYPFNEYTPTYTQWIDPGYMAQGGDPWTDVTDQVVVDNPVDMNTPGEYTVTYSITNYSATPTGDTTIGTRTVIVTDGKTGITLGANNGYTQGDYLVHTLGDNWVEPPIYAMDPILGDLSGDVVITSADFSPTVAGDYVRTFSLTNARAEVSEAKQIVKVIA